MTAIGAIIPGIVILPPDRPFHADRSKYSSMLCKCWVSNVPANGDLPPVTVEGGKFTWRQHQFTR